MIEHCMESFRFKKITVLFKSRIVLFYFSPLKIKKEVNRFTRSCGQDRPLTNLL